MKCTINEIKQKQFVKIIAVRIDFCMKMGYNIAN